jgi:hypothetical protein
MMEKGKCKTKYPTFKDWYATLNADFLDETRYIGVIEGKIPPQQI